MAYLTNAPLDYQESFGEQDYCPLIDVNSEAGLQHLLVVATRIFKVPVALFYFTNKNKQWIIASKGAKTGNANLKPFLKAVYSGNTVGPEPLILADIQNSLLYSNKLSSKKSLPFRFFAGAVFKTPAEYNLGALCLLDFQPREMSEEEKIILTDLAILAEEQVKMSQTNHQLSQTEANLKALLSNSLQSFMLIDPQHCIQVFNSMADQTNQAVWGRKLQVGESIYHYVHPHDLNDFNRNFNMALSGKTVRLEKNIIGRDGSDNWFEVSYNPVLVDGLVIGVCFGVVNINERKKALANLHLLDQAVAATNCGIIITDANQPDQPIIFANKGFETLTGYSQAEILGRNCRFLQGSDRNQPGAAIIRWALAEGRECTVELRNYRKDGSLFWIELRLTPLRNSEGQITHFVGVQTDITARVLAEDALRRRETELETLVENSPDVISRLDRQGRHLYINKAISRVSHGLYQPEAIVGKTVEEAGLNFEHTAQWNSVVEKVFNTGREETFEFESPPASPGGKPSYFQTWIVPEFEELNDQNTADAYQIEAISTGSSASAEERPGSKTVKSVLTITRDISELKHTETLLRASEERFAAFMHYSPAAKFILDEDGRFLNVNKAYLELFEFEETIVGRYCSDLFPVEISKQHREQDQWVLQNQQVLEVTDSWPRKDGTIGYWLGYKFPMQDANGRGLVGGVGIDITHRKKAEEALAKSEAQLRQSQKMEAIGQLAGGVAHDFNNLLTAILGYSELILAGLDARDPLYEDVNEIGRAADRATALTRQLLAFSRQQVLQPVVLDLNEVVAEMNRMLRRLIGEDIKLITVYGEALPQLKADRSQLEQVIVNLAVNARDAMPKGGKLIFETATIELTEEYSRFHTEVTPGNYVRLAVSDTGTGMNETVRARLFEPFFTTKERGRGTGLGLSTVYGIIKQSGGHIEVYSEEGYGTTFKIYLPAVSSGDEVHDGGVKVENSLIWRSPNRETVLLVEDEDSVRNLASRVLEQYGYTVLEARDGGEALLICEHYSGQIQLLLTDLIMPQLSGVDLAKRLNSLQPHMKVLYMSGYSDQLVAQQHRLPSEELLKTFIHKPFTPKVLAQKVREVLECY